MNEILTLAAEWERIAQGIMKNWQDVSPEARRGGHTLFMLGARATLNMLELGADHAALDAECTEFVEAKQR